MSEKTPQKCLWYEQCQCDKICEDYTPLEESDDVSDVFLAKRKYRYRKEFFEYAEELEIFES